MYVHISFRNCVLADRTLFQLELTNQQLDGSTALGREFRSRNGVNYALDSGVVNTLLRLQAVRFLFCRHSSRLS